MARSPEAYLDGARVDLDGDPLGVSVYAAAPFRFGLPREHSTASTPRIVIEAWPSDTDEAARRISLAPADALHLARILVRMADELTFVMRSAAHPD